MPWAVAILRACVAFLINLLPWEHEAAHVSPIGTRLEGKGEGPWSKHHANGMEKGERGAEDHS
jgi:hypothetical protein